MKIREFYNAVIANETNTEEVREHAQNELAKMDAQNEKRRNTPSKKAQENEVLANELLTKMEQNTVYTSAQVGEMMGGIHSSKATAILKVLIERNTVKCVGEVKGKSGKVKGYQMMAASN